MFCLLTIQSISNAQWIRQSSPTPDFLGQIVFTDSLHGWSIGWDNTIIATKNGGNTWFAQTCPTAGSFNSIRFFDSITGYGIGEAGLFSTTNNGGQTWEIKHMFDDGRYFNCFSFITTQHGWIGGYHNHDSVWVTIDGGNTFTTQDPFSTVGCIIHDIFFVDELNGWIVKDCGQIVNTSNGGNNWNYQNSGTNQDLYSVYFIDSMHGWVVGNSGVILYTENGGSTWTNQNSGTTVDLTSVHF